MNSKLLAREKLKLARLKTTKAREAILEVFETSHKPLSAEDIYKRLKIKSINQATVYRTLVSLEEGKILRQIDLRQSSVFYEMADNHHHHIVCVSCGDLEDLEVCIPQDLIRKAKQGSKKFSQIDDHSLEFFSKCDKCLKR